MTSDQGKSVVANYKIPISSFSIFYPKLKSGNCYFVFLKVQNIRGFNEKKKYAI